MADVRKVTDDFSVAPQISPQDVPELAGLGFVKLINNRPDGEVPDQPSSAEMEAAASACRMASRCSGRSGPGSITATSPRPTR